jgi:hypothetical protein
MGSELPLWMPQYQPPKAEEPAPGTQCARLLNYLRTGQSIDPLISWQALGIYRLGARIFDLRKAGWPIADVRKIVVNRFGEEAHVASYSLEGVN